ncbi:MAG: T9SS type A sorting domain-containing protein, partial [Hymenobacter sp.]
LLMTEGILTPLYLILGPTATISETDASYLLGDVQTTRTVGTAPEAFGGLGLTLATPTPAGATRVTRVTGSLQGPSGAQSLTRYFIVEAATGQSIPGSSLTFNYLPHELNGQLASQLTLFYSKNQGATWTNEGATGRDPAAATLTRTYLPDVNGRWTLGNSTAFFAEAPTSLTLTAFPIPFSTGGLTVQVTTATPGPLSMQLYDVLGRVVFSKAVLQVEAGASLFRLPELGALLTGRYVLFMQQAGQQTRLQVLKE